MQKRRPAHLYLYVTRSHVTSVGLILPLFSTPFRHLLIKSSLFAQKLQTILRKYDCTRYKRETFPHGISYKIVPCDDKRKRVRCNNGSLTIFSTERDPVPPINDLGGWLRNTSHKTVYHYRLHGGHQLQCILLYTTKKLVTHCIRWYTYTQNGVLS